MTAGMVSIEIAGKRVGPGQPMFVIAEIAQAHDGSLGFAHAFIDAAAAAGADMVKFQTHIAAEESTQSEPWRIKFSLQDDTRFDYWQRMEFTPEQWSGLRDHAREKGIAFSSSPFSVAAVELLDRLGTDAWKLASGQHQDAPVLERMLQDNRPVLISTGMSSWDEIDATVAAVKQSGSPFAVFQCTTAYPTPPEKIGLNVLAELESRYNCPVGLSDHSATTYAGLAAAALGASLLEAHITFDRRMFGPDTKASLTFDELADLCRGRDFLATAAASPVDKNTEAGHLDQIRITFGKGLVAARNLHVGTVLSKEDLVLKKNGGGLPYSALQGLIGKSLRVSLKQDQRIDNEHIED